MRKGSVMPASTPITSDQGLIGRLAGTVLHGSVIFIGLGMVGMTVLYLAVEARTLLSSLTS
jgi:hypothetical protein